MFSKGKERAQYHGMSLMNQFFGPITQISFHFIQNLKFIETIFFQFKVVKNIFLWTVNKKI